MCRQAAGAPRADMTRFRTSVRIRASTSMGGAGAPRSTRTASAVLPRDREPGTLEDKSQLVTSWLWLPVMVGARGFEPPASPTPKVRATPAPRPDDHTASLYYMFSEHIPFYVSFRDQAVHFKQLSRQLMSGHGPTHSTMSGQPFTTCRPKHSGLELGCPQPLAESVWLPTDGLAQGQFATTALSRSRETNHSPVAEPDSIGFSLKHRLRRGFRPLILIE
jgi:hypothetical protein